MRYGSEEKWFYNLSLPHNYKSIVYEPIQIINGLFLHASSAQSLKKFEVTQAIKKEDAGTQSGIQFNIQEVVSTQNPPKAANKKNQGVGRGGDRDVSGNPGGFLVTIFCLTPGESN